LSRRVSKRIYTRALTAVGAIGAMIAALLVGISSPANAAGTGTGYLHTSGSKIVDSTGATVRLTGINWFGMETDNHTFHGLWAQVTWRSMIDHMAQLGYNTIRVPYTGDSLRAGAQATSINTNTNPDLVGMSPLQILDQVVDYAGSKGMRILLDRHRPSAAGQTALWYTSSVSEASEIADWQMLAQRYANNPTVIGADLFNEPHAEGTEPNSTGACWGCGVQARDWRLAAQRIGNAVLQANSNWLVIVEGVSCPSGGVPNTFDGIPDDPLTCDWWGGNLAAAADFPVQLSVANRLVYSAHDYGISVFDRQSWFNDPNFPNNLPDVWNHFWGYLVQQNIAPVLIGEFGSTLQNPLDGQWMTKLMQYMGSGVNGMSFTYWSWNPDSGDTGGIVQDDWVTVNQNKQSILQPYLIPPVGGGTTSPPPTDTTAPTTPAGLAASGTTSTSTNLAWTASTDSGGSGLAGYDILRATGASGGTFAQVGTSTTPSFAATGLTASTTYRFQVRARDGAGNLSAVSNTVTVTTTGGGAGGGCSVTATTQTQWDGGYVIQPVHITNTGTSSITNWTVTFTLPAGHTITNLWNGTVTVSGGTVTVHNNTQNPIAANGTYEFGFQATRGAGDTSLPSGYTCSSP
jgi:endoglucanase